LKIALNVSSLVKSRKNKKSVPYVLIGLFIGLLLVFIAFNQSFDFFNYLKLKGIQGPAFRANPSEYISSVITQSPKSLISRSDIKNLNIDIKLNNWQSLMKHKERALKNGIISNNEKKYIKGSVSFDGNKVPTKIRLKGDWVDHLLGKKLSLRFKLEDDSFINGMSTFSIQNPSTRDFQGQLIIDKMLREYDIISPRNFLVNTKINGDDIGLMFFSEHFSKELLENFNRKESVIIKFDESELWKSRLNNKIYEADEFSSKITAFGMSKVKNNEKLFDDYKTAVGLLRGFLSQSMMAHEVFDVKKMGEFLAINDFWGESHGLIWHNLRFYFNPISFKLEPIGFDQMLYHNPDTLDLPKDSIASSKFLDSIRDNGFVKLIYIRTLKELKNKIQDADYYNQYVDLDITNEKILRKEFFLKPPPLLLNNDLLKRLNLLIQNAISSTVHMEPYGNNLGWAVNPRNNSNIVDLIYGKNLIEANMFVGEFYKYGLSNLGLENPYHGYRLNKNENSKLNIASVNNDVVYLIEDNPDLKNFQRIVNFYSHSNDQKVIFEIENLTPITIKVKKIKVIFKEEKNIIPQEINLDDFNLIMQANSKNHFQADNISYQDVERFLLYLKPVGGSQNYIVESEYYPKTLTINPIPKSTIINGINTHSFLQVDNKNKTIDALSGDWNVESPIIIPEGFTFNISENTILNFNKDSFILSNGQINFIGSSSNPIILKPQDNIKSWKGVKVFGNSELPLSIVKNVHIYDTSALSLNKWKTDAGFLAYKITLESNNLKIINNKTEDAINLVQSDFSIKDIDVINSYSDGLDVDFSTGTIVGGSFTNIGNLTGGDALDFSGSEAKIYDISVFNVDDKGLSIGEKSRIFAKNIDISEANIGIAIKDESSLEIFNSDISNSESGILAYIKKREYGPPQALLEEIGFSSNKVDYEALDGSKIIFTR
jgi:hypothetical protein